MDKIFNIENENMRETKSVHTFNEIYQQPKTWKKTCSLIKEKKQEIQTFIDYVVSKDDYDIILAGAGTSEFIGNALYSNLNKKLKYKVKSYATTDLVLAPENYISKDRPILMISFGRSGNSPESIGAIDVVERINSNVYHLFITCNKEGKLSKRAKHNAHCLALNLTDETHDKGFAMTSSFTNMYLAMYLCFNLDRIEEVIEEVNHVINAGQQFLDTQFEKVKEVADTYDFNRIVYLGSDVFKGVAQESALKMLELTAGKVVILYDTPLGFRHGPKSIIDDSTLIVMYVNGDAYTRRYEIDLLKEMYDERKGNKIVALMTEKDLEDVSFVDYHIAFQLDKKQDNVILGLVYILFAQLLAVYKSLSLDITPDNPCPTGEVNRVVQGVTLYPYEVEEI